MEISVIGAGAIGGTLAALAASADHAVTVTARGATFDALHGRSLTLTGAWGEHTTTPRVRRRLEATPDVAFVCVKASDLDAALEANREYLHGIPVVIVQNGLSGLERARTWIPESECVGGLALFAASYHGPGKVTVTAPGATYVGRDDGSDDAVAEVAALLNEFMPAEVSENFTGAQWSKLIVNEVNALPAITGLSVQETIAHGGLRRVLTDSMREAVRIGRATGIRFGALAGLSDPMLRTFAAAPTLVGQVLPKLMARRMGRVPNPGSTLQSLRRGQRTEIDYLTGAVVAAAREIGRDAPYNRDLTALVHEVEATGTFLDPREVVDRVRTVGMRARH